MIYKTPLTLITTMSILAIATPAYAGPDGEGIDEALPAASETSETKESTDADSKSVYTYNDEGHIIMKPEAETMATHDDAPLAIPESEGQWDAESPENPCPDDTVEPADGSCMVSGHYEY